MIDGRTILFFSSGYDAPPTSKHHVAHLLSEQNAVLWINYHASRTPGIGNGDFRRILKKLAQVFGGLKNPRKNLFVLTPILLPLPGKVWAEKINAVLLRFQIARVLKKVARGPVQVWSFSPDIAYLLPSLCPEKVVYYCVDDFAHFDGYDSQQVLRDEKQLISRADLVVTTSAALQESRSPLNPHTILVRHGVDYEHFSRAWRESLPEPADLADIPHPRLGFFGLIRQWVDLDLLAAVARARGDWHIVLVGDSTIDLAPYKTLTNIHFIGPRPYQLLPAYCGGFDAGLIPFIVNELTTAVNPIKLKEYISAGLAVASTPLPEVLQCNQKVWTGQGLDGFCDAVASALAQPRQQLIIAARAMAKETWPEKVDRICDMLNQTSNMTADESQGSPS